jgi:hypothetical protein
METKTQEGAAQDVLRWRREQLTRCGFPLPLAGDVARDARYDLHALLELCERGCRPDLAVRILAPVEEGRV